MPEKTAKAEVVKFNNDLNQIALSGLCATELDLFMAICSKMKENGSNVLIISFTEIKKVLGISRQNNKYLLDCIESISKKLTTIRGTFKNGNSFASFTLFSTLYATLEDEEHATLGHVDKNTLVVRVNEDFAYLLNEFSRGFTIFELKEFVKLESKYSKNLYRILKQWRTTGLFDSTKAASLDKFKELIGGEGYITREFTRHCINTAVAELKDKGLFKNLEIEVVRGIGRGRPVEGYIFTFDKESAIKSTDNESSATSSGASKGYSSPKKNKFNNFTGRNYDDSFFDDLEKIKLAQ